MTRKTSKRTGRAIKTPRRFSWAVKARARTFPGVMPLTGCGGSDGAPIKWPT
jgi:hypothetical protein